MRKLRLTELNPSAQAHQSQDSNPHLSDLYDPPLFETEEQWPDLEIQRQGRYGVGKGKGMREQARCQ